MVVDEHFIVGVLLKVVSCPTYVDKTSCDHQVQKFVVGTPLDVKHLTLL